MKRSTLMRALLATAIATSIVGCAPRRSTVVYQERPGVTGQTIVVQHPSEPPAVPTETIPQPPDTDYIWVRGHWEWSSGRWVWEPGHWEHPNPGHIWVPAHWERTGNGYVWVSGHWR